VLDLDVESSDLSNDELLMKAYRGDVPDALLARLANFGRYLLISSANKGTLPPNLQGIWNGNYLPPWWCTFFFNENLQMAIWPALPGGLPECVEGVFDLLEERMDDFRTNAKNMFACRGILPPLYMSPECGLKKNLQAHVQFWTGSGAWLAQIYFDYWLHTGDREFLAKRAIPFMREVAWFYEDFLVEGQDGLLHNYPGNSPENHPLGHATAKGHPARICVDATMDFALLREVLGNLIEAVRLVEGGDSEDTKRWQGMLKKLPAYRINEDGAIAEWVDARQKDNYHHRHLSHLYPLFPGFEITPDNTELFEACRVAVEKRLVVGLADQTGWSLSHMAHIYSRLGKPGRALQSLQLLCRSVVGVNLFTAHNDLRDMGITMDYRKGPRPLVQTEANNGITSAVYEMLALSTPGTLRLLPALPWSWRHGSLKGMRLRGGGILDLEWDRTEGWWRAHFTGENRRVLFGNDRGKSLELHSETVQTAEGVVHKLEGVFHESAFAAST
jgi:alpha-L-fucosidase 2